MNKQIGPVKVVIEIKICRECFYFEEKLVRTGINPVYESYCKHPKLKECVGFMREGRRIGTNTDLTPWWCPEE
jgi:hypothetical protein